MSQPMAALALALLASTGAGAQPRLGAREVVLNRQLVVSIDAAGPVPQVRVAPGVRTTILFDAFIDPDAVRLESEGTRVRLVDAGKRTVTVEALTELDKAGAVLRAPYADGKAPQVATLALVSDPAQVDAQISVSRRAQSFEALQAELMETRARCDAQGAELAALKARCEVSGPGVLILAGLLDEGVSTNEGPLPESKGTVGFRFPGTKVVGHRAAQWAAVAMTVENLPGQPPWRPGKAQLVSTKTGTPVSARVVMRGSQLAPGESGRVVMETGALPCELGKDFNMELWDADGGRLLSISGVSLAPPTGSECEDTQP